ncbi:MAG: MetQ/NlpA family ABC transporter substrate-binding protein [Candidatus Accumulibacter sp.]|jgi:D-methionine transport system substrate-binding protein|nr:MetQ/NlpA family ABC transporter substrate-binding protein [Accumulibacter sp.]
MKRLAFAALFLLGLASSAWTAEGGNLSIGVTPFPHAEIARIAAPLLAREGYTLVIREFNDYVQPNLALADKSLDANFFQHVPYLDNMSRERKLDLVWVAKIHIEPLGFYSQKIKTLSELKKGDRVAVPNDPTNEARALRLLEKNGLLSLKPGELVTVRDLTANPRELKLVELEAAQLPRSLPDVTAAVINTNFATEAGLIPSRDAIVIEDRDSPYANVIAVRSSSAESPEVKALVRAFQSPEVKAYIERELVPRGIVPAY